MSPRARNIPSFRHFCQIRPIRLILSALATLPAQFGSTACMRSMPHQAVRDRADALPWSTKRIRRCLCTLATHGNPGEPPSGQRMGFLRKPDSPTRHGPLIRLCLRYDIHLWFIPPSEPWWNGIVEKFNDHYQQSFLVRSL